MNTIERQLQYNLNRVQRPSDEREGGQMFVYKDYMCSLLLRRVI